MKQSDARTFNLPPFTADRSVYEQLRDRLRELIATGVIASGARMPSQRILARDLRVSRNTVIAAYEALTSEGLLQSRSGAGTHVVASVTASHRPIDRLKDPAPALPLQHGVAALDLFPMDTWRRIQERVWKNMHVSDLAYGDPAGWSGLRYVVAQRLSAHRGVVCEPEQVQIVPTALHALRLACAALEVRGRQMWVDELGLDSVFSGLRAIGAELVPLPIDEDGVNIAFGQSAAPHAIAAYLTPVTQFPLGMTLSQERRTALLDWAETNDRWIIEDDYESDFSFEGPAPFPLAADERGRQRVFHLGTLNNLLFPSAQLAYLVAPASLVDKVAAARGAFDYWINAPLQKVVHDFIEGGHLAAHLRRCIEVYSERRAVLRRACEDQLSDVLKLAHQPRGLHVAGYLKAGLEDTLVASSAAEKQIVVHPFSQHRAGPAPVRAGVFLGFAGYSPRILQHSIDKLAAVFANLAR